MTTPSVASMSSLPPEPQVFKKVSKVPIVGGAVGVVSVVVIVAGISLILMILLWFKQKKTRNAKHISEDCRTIDNEIYHEQGNEKYVITILVSSNRVFFLELAI